MFNTAQNWYKMNMVGLAGYYDPHTISLYTGEVIALMIEGFKLPRNFRQPTTNLMIIFPPGESIFYRKPDRFYLNQKLRLKDGRIPGHYFEGSGFNDLSDKGWARYSFHLTMWKPTRDVISGTSIYDILEGIYKGLSLL